MKPIDEVEKAVFNLLNSNSINNNQIEIDTGIHRATIGKYRKQDYKISNMRWETIKKLYACAVKNRII